MSETARVVLVFWIVSVSAATAVAQHEKAEGPPDDACQVEVFNNLVSELMDAGKRGMLGRQEIPFVNPRDGWCFFQLAGSAAITLHGDSRPLAVARGKPPVEAMRYLPAGRHVLKVSGKPETLIVRAIPALVYNVYRSSTQIAPFGAQTWELLQKTVLPNCNMIESTSLYPDEMAEWRAEGKQWVVWSGVPGLRAPPTAPLEDAYRHWQKSSGYRHPLASGIQVDEFWGTMRPEILANASDGIRRLAADPAFKDHLFIPFVVAMHRTPDAVQLMQAVLKAGWPFSIEIYLAEQLTETANREYLRKRLIGEAQAWEKAMPGCLRKAIITPMYSALPYCMTNTCPSADFKVHLDMQMEILANEPIFAGVYGVQFYRSNYVDPDTLRCSARLLRHYCIEGKKERYFQDSYELKHLLNPDFQDGTAHWELRPAASGSITVGQKAGYGALEGRYPWSQPYGHTFLVMKRNATKPNAFSQEIKRLRPGRLYSLKMITANHQDLQQGKSKPTSHAVSIGLEGVELVTGPENAFSCPFRSVANVGKFSKQNPFWMNYHWRVFRAKSPTARLTVTDWKDESQPGGPTGQELLVNFLELQPHLGKGD